MLIPNHPHEERLSALAAGDPEVATDAGLAEHVASCTECTATVGELSALRASLAELPDLRPHRPLRLIPEVGEAPSRADRLGGWARRFFAPALAAGAALAMVGAVGTAAPSLPFGASGAALQAEDAGAPQIRAMSSDGSEFVLEGAGSAAPSGATEGMSGTDDAAAGATEAPSTLDRELAREEDGGGAESLTVPAERSVWPMVLFSGVALMIAAALLRWILAPRAG